MPRVGLQQRVAEVDVSAEAGPDAEAVSGADEAGEGRRSSVEEREREGVRAGAGLEHGGEGGDSLRGVAGLEASPDGGVASGGGRGEWWVAEQSGQGRKCPTKCGTRNVGALPLDQGVAVQMAPIFSVSCGELR